MRTSGTSAKQRAYRLGRWAETTAAWFLRLKAYRILETRYVSPVGEIDLIARRGRVIIFVEVKARHDWDSAAQTISIRQRQRIVRAALHWQQTSQASVVYDLRFDAILVNRFGLPRHLTNAFQAS